MSLIVYHLHEHKLQTDSRVTKWPSTNAHQCHTAAALSRAFLEKPGRMPFLDQQSMRRHPLKTPRISQRFASEGKFGPWCCDLDENHAGHLPTLIPLFLGISFQGTWYVPFLEGYEVAR